MWIHNNTNPITFTLPMTCFTIYLSCFIFMQSYTTNSLSRFKLTSTAIIMLSIMGYFNIAIFLLHSSTNWRSYFKSLLMNVIWSSLTIPVTFLSVTIQKTVACSWFQCKGTISCGNIHIEFSKKSWILTIVDSSKLEKGLSLVYETM